MSGVAKKLQRVTIGAKISYSRDASLEQSAHSIHEAIGAQLLRDSVKRAHVRVSIDQTWQQRLAFEIDDLGISWRTGSPTEAMRPFLSTTVTFSRGRPPVPSTTSAPASARSLATALRDPARVHRERVPGDEAGLVRDEPSDTLGNL